MDTEKAEKFDKVKYNNQWQAANCDRINFVVKKGRKKAIHAAAVEQGESINQYIKTAVTARYEADTGEKIEL